MVLDWWRGWEKGHRVSFKVMMFQNQTEVDVLTVPGLFTLTWLISCSMNFISKNYFKKF